eukprot:c31683_g1_i1 orf=55-237(-)
MKQINKMFFNPQSLNVTRGGGQENNTHPREFLIRRHCMDKSLEKVDRNVDFCRILVQIHA